MMYSSKDKWDVIGGTQRGGANLHVIVTSTEGCTELTRDARGAGRYERGEMHMEMDYKL